MKRIIILCALFSVLVVESQEQKLKTDKIIPDFDVYFPVDWKSIKPIEKTLPRLVCLEGYLGFEGSGDFPRIILWETDEARKQQMTFRRLLVQSESASPMINRHFGAGVDSWKVLEGMFISIKGVLEIEPDESRHLFIGKLNSIKSIAVRNNGLDLFRIQ